jgi:large subunit ribosomal protein L31
MKADIHPTYYPDAVFTCACGATYDIGSTKEAVQVEICAKCHPFYTGTEKTLDSAGRVDKFNSRKAAADKSKSAKK